MAYTTLGIDGKISRDQEKKVSCLDECGEENRAALPQEIERLLLKTAKVDKDADPNTKGFYCVSAIWLAMRSTPICDKCFTDALKYHADRID